MKSKLLSTYILQGTLVLILSLVWGGWVGCSSSNNTSPNGDGGNYLTVNLNLRAQEDGQNTLNKDLQDEEDKVHELRIMLFQGGDLKYNFCYNVPGGVGTDLAFNGDPSVRRAVFRLPKPGVYDMVVIANEHVNTTEGPTITSKLNAIARRDQLNDIRIDMPTIYKAGTLPNIKLRSPMTAEYKNVDMNHSGTQATPYQIILPTPSRGVELLRCMAKVELLLKDMIEVEELPNNQKKYSWIGSGSFERVYTIQSANMPKSFSLMPQNQLTPDAEVASGVLFNNIPLPATPDPRCVIEPVSPEDPSIGGVLTADYRLAFYIPEYLAKTGLADASKPLLKFTYKYWSNIWDPSSLTEKTSKHPMKNPNLAVARQYLQEVVTLHGGTVVTTGEYSVYRNSCYRISVRFQQ
ncbi:hypothetical protein [Porphyromonas endodontalis]